MKNTTARQRVISWIEIDTLMLHRIRLNLISFKDESLKQEKIAELKSAIKYWTGKLNKMNSEGVL